ncbi:hypothetical protein [Cellulomonas marina]|uniref:Uncharacterized protein n=1 Tax=Cellulomonas marina TaxID=988821 RepID=A0A1I1AG69_9CELL|nr:hypothetical protein [Cellulomonas marina]GIG30208.1 hypothetical protein Cma02nite_28080 [Cellulomonas marina]SFB36957.1 hypothetical protein SAMN05421867_11817 [Cellulomonas marina]
MTTAHDALHRVLDAFAYVTLAAGELSHEDRLADVLPALDLLDRTMRRVRTIVAMHPETRVGGPVQDTLFALEDLQDARHVEDTVAAVAALPSAPVRLTLRSDGLSGPVGAMLGSATDGQVLTAVPDGEGYLVDLAPLLQRVADGPLEEMYQDQDDYRHDCGRQHVDDDPEDWEPEVPDRVLAFRDALRSRRPA